MGASTKEPLTPDDLDRPDWNSLLNNYDKHDIGEAYFQGRVEQIGLAVEHWGIDKRHHDDALIFDNKMDLRLWEPLDGQRRTPDIRPDFTGYRWAEEHITGELSMGNMAGSKPEYQEMRWDLAAIADVKTKANSDWMGKFNLRHLVHYAEWADKFDVPVFIYMTMVDPDAQVVGEESFLTPIPSDWEWKSLTHHFDGPVDFSYGAIKDKARTCDIVKRTFRAPDGNLVVNIADEHKYNFDWFTEEVLTNA